MAEPTAEADSATSSAPGSPAPAPRRKRLALMVALPTILLLGALAYWWSVQGQVSTDNAYVKQDTVGISSEVGGKIIEVLVKEGQRVKRGTLLYRVDPEPFQVKIDQAVAAIAKAQSNVTALRNDEALSGADISGAREDIAFAQSRLKRQDALWARGFTTKSNLDAARHAVAQARDGLRAAQARAGEALAKLSHGAAIPGENAEIAAAKADREQAELDLRRAEVRSPIAGRVAQSERLQLGQMAIGALPMLTIVNEASSYIEANFKETQLADMEVGQRAIIEVDAYPEVELEGHVSSIGSGTGAEFSVLPAQNATGNWVKVTQRIPVRIKLDEKASRRLIAGLSVQVTVFTSDSDFTNESGNEKAQ